MQRQQHRYNDPLPFAARPEELAPPGYFNFLARAFLMVLTELSFPWQLGWTCVSLFFLAINQILGIWPSSSVGIAFFVIVYLLGTVAYSIVMVWAITFRYALGLKWEEIVEWREFGAFRKRTSTWVAAGGRFETCTTGAQLEMH